VSQTKVQVPSVGRSAARLRRPATKVHRPATGWASLTQTERRVAELAADGLTSREIGSRLYVSTLTVGSHMSSIYRKLGINSRVQLANRTNQRDHTRE